MQAYVLIGNPNTRKSTLVRSLSGCFNRSLRDIQPVSGAPAFRLYARAGALQETRTTPSDFVHEVAGRRCAAVLFCLWPLANPVDPANMPDAGRYLEHFESAGWRLKSIAVLGQNPGGWRGAAMRQFPQAPVDPVNLTAHQLRAHFGWL
ncbi:MULTISPECIES: hypothetical protein [Rubrivivax]|uniref:G domain-containing protein n=1 Tax=Rubrivivax benzoatilyticus TaxID=316997 RepID=A0ABX0HRJ5_9BURK|nr:MULTISPECIES: hypothetical protein [Rubrivivax]EGJ10477.1 hypothetical protein RBXJA2T_09127 [Rubrivivax benzoatilyticus JA2 = ATCC BAA-35]NHK96820.1 hypothetical protein [Rubrivivax benzoatilyticus]NHL24535.1 hypothetical protein [Rubrivivax benzoatilyticus]